MINKENGTKYEFSVGSISENDTRTIASKLMKSNSKILDIGCACGDFALCLKGEDEFEIYGLEYDAESIRIANDKKIYKKIEQCDLNSFDSNIFFQHKHTFDYVCMLDVIEHTWDPEKTIRCALSFLKPGGSLIISLPNISHSSIKSKLLNNDFTYTKTGILDETHIRFFTYKSIALLMSKLNLKIEVMKPKIKIDKYNELMLPRNIKKFIFKDKHSYVYQYVFLAKINHSNINSLFDTNLLVMNPEIIVSKYEILKENFKDFYNLMFPEKSRGKKLLKKFIFLLKTNFKFK